MKKLFSLLLFVFSINVYAHNCPGEFQPESGSCRIIGPDGRQIIYNSDPPQSGGSTVSPPKIIRHVTVNIPSKYGALAQDKNGIIRSSSNENSWSEAKKSALKQCNDGKKNQQCKILTSVRNGCYAAAAGKQKNNWFTYAWSGELGKTEHQVMKFCESKYSDCRIVVPETCSIP